MPRSLLTALLVLASSVPAFADEAHPVWGASGRLIAMVPIESENLDRVLVAANPKAESALATILHGRRGGASLYLVTSGAAREILRTTTTESLSQAAWSPDGARFALARITASTWIPGPVPRLQSHGHVLVSSEAKGGLRALGAADDVGRVLGWLDERTVAIARVLPGDLPEERPWALDLESGAMRALFAESTVHLYALSLLSDSRLYFARSRAAVVTLPGRDEEVELVQRDPRAGAERVLAVERGALPAAQRVDGMRLSYALDGTLTGREVDLQTGAVRSQELPRPRGTLLPSPSPGGDLAMPYIHQVYDTPDDFSGGWACGPTSTLMCILHYGKLQPWPVTASTPYSHTSDYGAYDAYVYSAYGSTFDRMQTDASGRASYGAYGWCTEGGGAWAWRMQDYAQRHDLSSDFYSPSNFGDVVAAIDAGKTIALSTHLTSAGHIIAVKGYTAGGEVVANDPYGNKNSGYMNYGGENAVYTWAQVNSSWFITVYGAVTPTNKPPGGYLDAVDCTQAGGWAQDPDEPGKAIDVHVYWGGPAGSGAPGVPLNAGIDRADLCAPLGSCNHGFALRSPFSLFDGAAHEVHAYGIDSQGGANAELATSPKSLQCAATPPAGVKRHVTDPTVYGAWKFDAFMDQMRLVDAQVDAMQTEVDIAPAPVMIRADGEMAVYLLDHGYKRHVPSVEIAANWRLDLGAVQVKPPAEVDVYPLAPPLRARPVLVIGSGPAVWLVDDALPGADAGMPGPDAAAPGPDAASPEIPDAGAAVKVDAGQGVVTAADGGTTSHPADAGKPAHDGGPNGSDVKAGCGCATTSPGVLPLFAGAFALLALGRRGRRPHGG